MLFIFGKLMPFYMARISVRAMKWGTGIAAVVLLLFGVYKKYQAGMLKKSKLNSYITEGRIYSIEATTGQRHKIKYYYYDHISTQEPHTGEITVNGSNASTEFIMTNKSMGLNADAPIDVYYDSNNPDDHFTDKEIAEIDKTANQFLHIGIICAVFSFIFYMITV